jgi:group I intron endonuclease
MQICGIYQIVRIDKDEVYVGASVDIKRRFSCHKARMKNSNHYHQTLNEGWKLNQIRFEILEECEELELKEREDYWIKHLPDVGYKIVNKNRASRAQRNSEEGKLHKSLAQMGSRNGNSRLTDNEIIKIKVLARDTDITIGKLAEWFGVSQGHISNIIKGIKWKHININNINIEDIKVD